MSNAAEGYDVEARPSRRESVCVVSRLRKLPPGPFRSLGQHLDYTGWADCERFMELDREIQRTGDLQMPDEIKLVA
jgi:hypothetical protein